MVLDVFKHLSKRIRAAAERIGLVKPRPAMLLMRTDIQPPLAPPPTPPSSLATLQRQRERDARAWAEYVKEFPYPEPHHLPIGRVQNRGPEVSGGLPSLGKRRP